MADKRYKLMDNIEDMFKKVLDTAILLRYYVSIRDIATFLVSKGADSHGKNS